MAMKQYRLGLNYDVWLQSLYLPSTTCRIMQKFPSEFKAEVKVVNGCLLFRSQRSILIPHGLTIQNLDRCSFEICPHVKLITYGIEANIPEIYECGIEHQHDRQRCVRKSEVVACTSCMTEYDFSLEECGSLGLVALVTRWKDLGEGKTVLDPKWLNHLSSRYPVYTSDACLEAYDARNDYRVSVRDSFESDESGWDVVETAEMLSRLPNSSTLPDEDWERMLFDEWYW